MIPDVTFHEGTHEEIAVVVARPFRISQWLARGLAGCLQIAWPQVVEKGVAAALIHQQRMGAGLAPDHFADVVFPPGVLVVAQVVCQRVAAPLRPAGRADRRKGRHRPVLFRLPGAHEQRAVTAHGVTADGLARRVDGQVCIDDVHKLRCHVVVHAVVRRPGRLRCIDVEARTAADVDLVILTGNVDAPGAGVGNDQGDTEFGGRALCAGLDDEVLLRTGESRQPVEGGHAVGAPGQEHGEPHGAGTACRIVLVGALQPAEAA